MDATFLVLTIVFGNSIEKSWREPTVFDAVCHGRALQMAQRAAARGWSIRYTCRKQIVGEWTTVSSG